MKKLDSKELERLFRDLHSGKAVPGTYSFGPLSLKVMRPMTPAERVKKYYETHPDVVKDKNEKKKETYELRKKLRICVRCGDREVATNSVMCPTCKGRYK